MWKLNLRLYGNCYLHLHVNVKQLGKNQFEEARSKYAISDSNGNGILDTYDKFIDGYSLCDVGITHQISLLKTYQIGVKNIFGFTNPEFISNITGRLYYMSFKINFK